MPKSSDSADAKNFEIPLGVDEEVNVVIINFKSLINVLTDIGGYGSIFFNLTLILVYPFLFRHFNQSIVESIQRTEMEAGITDSFNLDHERFMHEVRKSKGNQERDFGQE